MAMRNAKRPVQCETCGKTVLKKGLKKHFDMAHGEGQKYAFSSVVHSSNLENGSEKRVIGGKVVHEKDEQKTISECPHCLAREMEMKRLHEEVIPGLKTAAQKREEEVSASIAELQKRLAEKPAPVADTIPEDLGALIEHCESGQCSAHAQQWQRIKAQIVEANKPAIVQATLEHLPDVVVEAEGLRRGFIPQRIIIPISGNPARRPDGR